MGIEINVNNNFVETQGLNSYIDKEVKLAIGANP